MSRAQSDGYGNIVSLIATEPKPTEILPTMGPRTDNVIKVMGSKVEGTETIPAGVF